MSTVSLPRRIVLSLRLYSVQLALLAGALSSWFSAHPEQWAQLVALVPEGLRPLAAVAVFTIVPMIARTVRQPDLPEGTP